MQTKNLGPGVVTSLRVERGVLWCGYTDGQGRLCVEGLNPGTLATVQPVRRLGRGVFLRFSPAGPLWAVARRTDWDGEPIVLWDLTTGQEGVSLGPGWGNHPAALDDQGRVWWQESPTAIRRAPVTSPSPVTLAIAEPLPTGISHIDGDRPVMWDEVRQQLGGVVGVQAGPYLVREDHHGPTDNTGVLVTADSRQIVLWPTEQALAPVACVRPAGGVLVATWGAPGIRVARVDDEDLTDPAEPTPPDPGQVWQPPTPLPPLQTYEVSLTRPWDPNDGPSHAEEWQLYADMGLRAIRLSVNTRHARSDVERTIETIAGLGMWTFVQVDSFTKGRDGRGPDVQAEAALAAWLAHRYRQAISYLSVRAEPDNPEQQLGAEEYAALVNTVHDAVRAVNPSMWLVFDCEMVHTIDGEYKPYWDEVAERIDWNLVDVVSCHLYREPRDADYSGWGSRGQEFAAIRESSRDKPFYLGEVGWRGPADSTRPYDAQKQAANLYLELQIGRELGYLGTSIYTGPGGQGLDFGLFDSTVNTDHPLQWQERPAAHAVRAFLTGEPWPPVPDPPDPTTMTLGEYHERLPAVHAHLEKVLGRKVQAHTHALARRVQYDLITGNQTVEQAKAAICERATAEGAQKWPGLLSGICGGVTVPPPSGDRPAILRGDFLTTGSATGGERDDHTMFYAHEQPDTRQRRLNLARSRGYNVLSLYVENEGDFGNRRFDFAKDTASVATFKARLEEIRAAGLWPVVWLYPDDAPRAHARSTTSILERFGRIVGAVDGLVAAYVPGLEMDEYWDGDKQLAIVNGLATMTSRDILCHWTGRVWGGYPDKDTDKSEQQWWAKVPKRHVGLALQIPSGRRQKPDGTWTPDFSQDAIFRDELSAIVRRMKGTEPGKSVAGAPRTIVLGESNQLDEPEAFSIRRGRIALEVGCDGSLQGCPPA